MQNHLPSTFSSAGWSIRYKIFEAHPATSDGRSWSERTVVFVHGTAWSSIVFVPIAKALSAAYGCRILLYDLAGYGQSQTRPNDSASTGTGSVFLGDTSVRTQAEVFAALLTHLHLDGKGPGSHQPPSVIAHDIAGALVLRAHLFHACEYKSLMLLDTNAVLPWGDGFYKLVRSNPQVFMDMPASTYGAVVRSVIRSACHKPMQTTWEDALASPWLDEDPAISRERQISFVRQIAQANDADVAEMFDQGLYKNVRCNVKLVWGSEDTWIPRHKMDELAELLQGRLRSYVAVPQAGHLLMIDQPERVTVEIVSWLTIEG